MDKTLWKEGRHGDVTFLKAGQGGPTGTMSVSPISDAESDDVDDGDSIEGDFEGEVGAEKLH